MVMPALIALAALASTALAEWLHARRVARVARLAFGPAGRPATWALAAPAFRCAGVALAVFGAVVLMRYDPVETYGKPARQASKQLLFLLDVSPSMTLKDAGPDVEKVSRGVWAGKVAQAILDRLDTETTRVSLTAFYTKSLPVVTETFDKEVIRNALDGLPMYVAFEPGPTDIHKGVTAALQQARVWPAGSAMLVIISDGDASAISGTLSKPDAIADVIVIGVGDPHKSSIINGHGSRQDADSLKVLAARLGGIYHNGNEKHLPTHVLDALSLTSPRRRGGMTQRTIGLASAAAGSSILALLGPALVLAGAPGHVRRGRADVRRRSDTRPTAMEVPG